MVRQRMSDATENNKAGKDWMYPFVFKGICFCNMLVMAFIYLLSVPRSFLDFSSLTRN